MHDKAPVIGMTEMNFQMIEYQRFNPQPYGFPSIRVPVLPQRLSSWRSRKTSSQNSAYPSLFTQYSGSFYRRARYALLAAYRRAGLMAGMSLLAPGYHCRTLIDPALRLGATVQFYPLDAQLRPDLHAIARLIKEAKTNAHPVRALVVTHYFGFAQPLAELLALCRQQGIVLIEDCAHACFGESDGQVLGSQGDYAVASLCKFFSSPDGGVLIDNTASTVADDLRFRPFEEARGWWRALAALRQWRQPVVKQQDIDQLKPKLDQLHAQAAITVPLLYKQQAEPSHFYTLVDENRASLWLSNYLMHHSDVDFLVEQRRQNYQCWLVAVQDLPHCRPLFSTLPKACVPYMFPLYIDHPETHFFLLKKLGLPIWRWDEMAVSPCKVSMDYSLHLLHLPLHQDLLPIEMNWMTAALRAVMHVSPKVPV